MGTKFIKHEAKPIDALYWWTGNVSLLNKEERRAYQSWLDQRHRCNNKKSASFKYYGARGVRVLYKAREFVGWWLFQQNKLNLKKPTVSRIDHSGDYSIENIKLEEHLENCVSDVLKRHGAPSLKTVKKVVCFDYESKAVIGKYDSISEASKKLGVKHSNIYSIATGKPRKNGKRYLKTRSGYSFIYMEDLLPIQSMSS